MHLPTKRTIITGTLPTLLALIVAAFASLERAAVDPRIAAGPDTGVLVPTWYAPLAVFALAHTLARLLTMPGRNRAAFTAGLASMPFALVFHITGAPFLVGEIIYGVPLALASILLPLLLILPFAAVFAIGTGGALLGLSIHLPLLFARRLSDDPPASELNQPTRQAFVIGGIFMAFICVGIFGIPSQSERLARGSYSLDSASAQAIWYKYGAAVALSCAAFVLAGGLSSRHSAREAVTPFLAGFLLPIAIVAGAIGLVLGPAGTTGVYRSLRDMPLIATAARYFRDGRASSDDPIYFANGVLRVDRTLVRYQVADNPERRVVTIALRPPPGFEELGIRNQFVLNAWRGEPHRPEAERRKTKCTESATRPVIECIWPATGNTVIEIDKRRPERGFYRGAATDPCRLIITSIADRALSLHSEFDCASTDDWPRRAAEIEQRIATMHVPN